jgi:hypothetical protein
VKADPSVSGAVLRQVEVLDDHNLSLIEERLRLTPEERLQRLTNRVAFVASARPVQGSASGGRK